MQGLDPQPKARVGNVASGKGTVRRLSPAAVYQGETDRTIELRSLTAAGPMYDTAGV